MKTKKRIRNSTLSVIAGERERHHGHSVVAPVFQTATYSFASAEDVRAYHETPDKTRYEYGRYGSPTQLILERKLAEMHGTEAAVVTSSGMSAITDTLLALLKRGDRLVLTSECYRRTRVFCENYLSKFGVQTTFAGPDTDAIIRAITPRTTAVFCEIPTNPRLHVCDLPRIAAVCRRRRIPLLVDSTLAGPFNCDPFALGADLVVLSLTKYLGGHNDVIGGAVLGKRKAIDQIRYFHTTVGTLLPPFSVYLVLRGIKTAALRIRRQNENTERIARFLEAHPRVRQVFYPSLASHPDHEIATRLMTGFGGVVSFRLKSKSLRDSEAFLDRLKLFRIAASLGGVESLAETAATMSYWDKTPAERKRLGITDDLVRLAIGIEDAEDLIADLDQALTRS